MIRRLTLALLLLLAPAAPLAAQDVDKSQLVPRVAAGRIVDLGIVESKHADPRRVVVWLPSTYRRGGPRHAVLYMHDGQNLFDIATAGYGMEWKVDETLDRLIRRGEVRPTIVVGIWNTPKRLRDYVPAKAFQHLPARYMERVRRLYGGNPLSDGYLRFIVRELKPRIERDFRVRSDRANTVMMGSSMGGLISLYAINEYPELFGGAGMLSTHWPLMVPEEGEELSDADFRTVSSAFERYLTPALPARGGHKLYFDHGTETLDQHYARYQKSIDAIVARRGYRRGVNWISRNFPGHKHNELSWAERLDQPLRFLLPPLGAGR
ncbi:MAG TPA: alpha/beta hydrolase-fold protein [Sphingomicrobium sp.]|nr:alpha/beta hydrolase-fold protein [Sphingomicrobium sp.]